MSTIFFTKVGAKSPEAKCPWGKMSPSLIIKDAKKYLVTCVINSVDSVNHFKSVPCQQCKTFDPRRLCQI